MLELGVAFLNVSLSAVVSWNVYVVSVFDISLYGISGFEPVKEMHACKDVTVFPAELEYVIVGFPSSVKLATAVIVACLGMLVNATVNPLYELENLACEIFAST